MAPRAAWISVQLTTQEADHADDVARRILAGAKRNRWRDARGESFLRNNEVGARGELAAANWWAVPWEPTYTPQGHVPDVGPFDVKTASALAPSYQDRLTITARRLHRDDVYLAVTAWSRTDHVLVGWCTGADVQDHYDVVQPWPNWAPAYHVPYGDLLRLDHLPLEWQAGVIRRRRMRP